MVAALVQYPVFAITTNAPLALVFTKLGAIGLTPTDIHHIEYLSDRKVLEQLPGGLRWLKRNKKDDAIAYFETFANVLEEQLLLSIDVNMANISSRPANKIELFLSY